MPTPWACGDAFHNMAMKVAQKTEDTNYLLTGMILQVAAKDKDPMFFLNLQGALKCPESVGSRCWSSGFCTCWITSWWFQIFSIFTPTWRRFPIWLIFFRWVETTNQIMLKSSNFCSVKRNSIYITLEVILWSPITETENGFNGT